MLVRERMGIQHRCHQGVRVLLHDPDAVLADKKVLIVDDDIRNLFATTSMLERYKMEVFSAETGKAAVDSLRKNPGIDLVLMDIRLAHGDDGVDTAIALFEEFGVRSIFVSAHADDATQSRARKARPLGWLVNPFRLEELATVVKKALATGE